MCRCRYHLYRCRWLSLSSLPSTRLEEWVDLIPFLHLQCPIQSNRVLYLTYYHGLYYVSEQVFIPAVAHIQSLTMDNSNTEGYHPAIRDYHYKSPRALSCMPSAHHLDVANARSNIHHVLQYQSEHSKPERRFYQCTNTHMQVEIMRISPTSYWKIKAQMNPRLVMRIFRLLIWPKAIKRRDQKGRNGNTHHIRLSLSNPLERWYRCYRIYWIHS